MAQLTQDKLDGIHGAWFDVSTIKAIGESVNLQQPAPTGSSRSDCLEFANALGRLTVYDAILLDSRGLDSLRVSIPSELGCCFSVELDTDVYISAASAVEDAFSMGKTDLVKILAKSPESNKWWDGADKAIFDKLSRKEPYGPYGSALLGNSNNSFARVLFYLELAKLTGKSTLLSPSKNRLLYELQAALPGDAFDLIQKTAEKLFGSWQQTNEGAPSVFSTPICAPGEYVLSVAARNGCSPLHAVNIVRAEKECVAFRKVLSEFEGYVKSGRTAAKEIKQCENALKDVAELWGKKTNWDSRQVSRTLELTALPAIGPLLKCVGMDKLKVPDVDLWRKPNGWYFVAKWYSS